MKWIRLTKITWSVFVMALLAISPTAWAVPLAPSAPVLIAGTTHADRPELAGEVIRDELSAFEIRDAQGGLVFKAPSSNGLCAPTSTVPWISTIVSVKPTLPFPARSAWYEPTALQAGRRTWIFVWTVRETSGRPVRHARRWRSGHLSF